MECPKCHAENWEDSRFCINCAAPSGNPGFESGSLTKTLETPIRVLKPGTLIVGKYRILEEVGLGGIAVVYEAEDIKLKRSIDLVPAASSDGFSRAQERFLVEAQTAAALSRPNVYVIHEVGEGAGAGFKIR